MWQFQAESIEWIFLLVSWIKWDKYKNKLIYTQNARWCIDV